MSNVEHYGGEDNPYEVIKVAEAWGLDKDAYLFNVLKYIARAGKKPGESILKDLGKARDYVDYRIAVAEREKVPASQELGELSIKRHAAPVPPLFGAPILPQWGPGAPQIWCGGGK